MTFATTQKSERINVRITPAIKRILQEASATTNKTVTEFLIESALTEAAEVLADRRVFFLSEKHFQEFMEALDSPPSPMLRLKKLLQEPSILESQSVQDGQ